MAAPATEIRPVKTRRDLRQFLDLPYALYRDNPYWVPPVRLDVAHMVHPKKSPFFQHGDMQLFVATRGGECVGRIAAIVNGMHLSRYDDGTGFFGFFEVEERQETAASLLDAAGSWLKSKGLTSMQGPANPSLNDTAGLLIQGFDRPPSIMMPYNPPYYEDYLLQSGFEQVMLMWAFYVHRKYVKFDRLKRGANIIRGRNPGLSMRTLDMKHYDREAAIVREIYNEAWQKNWGAVPATEEEFNKLARDLKQIVDPRLAFILEMHGKPVGFAVALPDITPAFRRLRKGRLLPLGILRLWAGIRYSNSRDIRLPIMGVLSAYHGRGFDVLPVLETIEKGPEYGFHGCEMSWILDSNKVIKSLLLSIGAVVDKKYAMLQKPLAPQASEAEMAQEYGDHARLQDDR